MRPAAVLALAALALAGCSRAPEPAPQPTATSILDAPPTAEHLAAASAAAGLSDEGEGDALPPVAVASAAPAAAPAPVATERDPAKVLAAWAAAVTARDWAAVRAFWGDAGARSGLSERAFTRRWGALAAPQVSVGRGSQEGAAGSLYYTAPVTITDGKRRISGEIVLRRVNDVDGASPEQLRWHIESSTLAP